MKRSELESYLGKHVEAIIFDGDTYIGKLYKTGEEIVKNDPNLYLKKDYYFCSPSENLHATYCLFRSSHIKKIKIL